MSESDFNSAHRDDAVKPDLVVETYEEKLREELLEKLALIEEVYGAEYVQKLKQFGDLNHEEQETLKAYFYDQQPEKTEVEPARLADVKAMISEVMDKLIQKPGFFTASDSKNDEQ